MPVREGGADAPEVTRRAVLLGTASPGGPVGHDGATVPGDPAKLSALLGHPSAPVPDFAAVTS
ncbi:hypothetical protein [Streptomyces sp. NPDC056405]|uniref:hypothetical protein n=1 Tax=Streptomyces sp. NPDC056405 TaxID=3345811 RepID=UPI0035E3B20B